MIAIIFSQQFLVLFGVILIMILFKSKFKSTTEFLERLRKPTHSSPITDRN